MGTSEVHSFCKAVDALSNPSENSMYMYMYIYIYVYMYVHIAMNCGYACICVIGHIRIFEGV